MPRVLALALAVALTASGCSITLGSGDSEAPATDSDPTAAAPEPSSSSVPMIIVNDGSGGEPPGTLYLYTSREGGHLEWWVPLDWADISDWDSPLPAGEHLGGAWAVTDDSGEGAAGLVTVFRYEKSVFADEGWTTAAQVQDGLMNRLLQNRDALIASDQSFTTHQGFTAELLLVLDDDPVSGTGNHHLSIVIDAGDFFYEFIFIDYRNDADEPLNDFIKWVNSAEVLAS